MRTAFALLLLLSPLARAQYLLIPETDNHRVMLASALDAHIITPDFLRAAPSGVDLLISPRAAARVGDEIWVTDIRANSVHRFSADRRPRYIGTLPHDFDRPGGLCVVGSRVYIANDGDAFAGPGLTIAVHQFNGERTAVFAAPPSLDVTAFAGDLLVSDYAGGAIRRFSCSGEPRGTFSITPAPTQLHAAATGPGGALELWVASDTPAATIRRLDSTGATVASYPIGSYAHGVHTLTNGRIVCGGGVGIETLDPGIAGSRAVVEDLSAWFMHDFGFCPSPCIADFDASGGVDGSDVEAFFGQWSDGLSCADANDDGAVDGADVEAFFTAWESGAC